MSRMMVRRWVEIRSLPEEDKVEALRAIERRAGPMPPPPKSPPRCPHPPTTFTEFGGVAWCDLCSDELHTRARVVLKWLREHGPATVGEISSALELDDEDSAAIMYALRAGRLARNTSPPGTNRPLWAAEDR